jgi:hypothetical protein
MVFIAEYIGQYGVFLRLAVGNQSHGNARHRLLKLDAGVH